MRENKMSKHGFWLPRWERYLKKIPKRGLNNMTKKPYWFGELGYEWKGEPTLSRRLKKIIAIGPFTQAPPFLHYAGDMATFGEEKENLQKIRSLTKQILMRLDELYKKMDTVTVLPKDEIEYYKNRMWETILYIRKQSKWIGMEMIQEADFKIVRLNEGKIDE